MQPYDWCDPRCPFPCTCEEQLARIGASDITVRGHWRRELSSRRRRYYYRGVRVPWLLWAMFS